MKRKPPIFANTKFLQTTISHILDRIRIIRINYYSFLIIIFYDFPSSYSQIHNIIKVRTHSKKANPNFPSSINQSFYGSPKCLTITFTSFLENECLAGLYPMLRSSSDKGLQYAIQRRRCCLAVVALTSGK